MYLSENTLAKYKQGYKKAASVLSFYVPDVKVSDLINNKMLEKSDIPDYEISGNENFKKYRFTEINRLITKGLIREAKKPKKGYIQTGQADYKKQCYARIFTNPESGEIIAVMNKDIRY